MINIIKKEIDVEESSRKRLEIINEIKIIYSYKNLNALNVKKY